MKQPINKHKQADQRNLFIAVIVSSLLVVGWQIMVEAPKRQELAKWNAIQEQKKAAIAQREAEQLKKEAAQAGKPKPLTREDRLAQSPRVKIASDTLTGTIALKGLRFDDVALSRYPVTMAKDSPPVTLLSPARGADAYFIQLGWLAGKDGAQVKLPDERSEWKADRDSLTPASPVTFRWSNGEGVTFITTLSLDKQYMITATQTVENSGNSAISVSPYGYINRAYDESGTHYAIMHEGPLGVLDGTLSEIAYKELREKGAKITDNASGWFGITDKYWLTALIPDADSFTNKIHYYQNDAGENRYQAEYTLPALSVDAGRKATSRTRIFAGAKEIGALDAYAKGDADNGLKPILLFDRAVDFGVLYFLTKPMFLILTFFYAHLGNFGLAIIALTLLVKLCMFPLANKGYRASTQMRALQPELARLKADHGEDRMRMQQEMVALYKREKINPAAGCLPLLIQIPVFFALYKVLFVTIEMRHAPFYGWLKDLSAPDPTNVLNLFGLIPIDLPPALHIGVLPILMGVTMWIQMRQQPKPTDPTQAKVIGLMPYFLTFVLAGMPAGLVMYWICSNTLSIIQQWVITTRYNATHPNHKAA